MRLLALICAALLLAVGLTEAQPSSSKTILDNIAAIPSLSFIAKAVRFPNHADLRAMLSSSGKSFTLLAPSDSAVKREMSRINSLLINSGYPSLAEIQQNLAKVWNISDFPLFPSVSSGAIDSRMRLPPGLNITEMLIEWSSAQALFNTLSGTYLSSDLKAHQFLPTMLSSGKFVLLNGAKQRMHLENLTASMGLRAEHSATGIVATFGPLGDPIPMDLAVRALNNLTSDSGLDQYVSVVVAPDIVSSNGVIHIVDRVIELPLNLSYNLYTANQSSFLTALNQTGLLKEIQNQPNITVFAPTDAAFESAKSAGMNETDLRSLCLKHIARGAFYPTDLYNGLELESLSDSHSKLRISGSTMNFRVNDSPISVRGLLMRNGAMYFVDRVLGSAGFAKISIGLLSANLD